MSPCHRGWWILVLAALVGACAVEDRPRPPRRAGGETARPDEPGEWARFMLQQRVPVGAKSIPAEAYANATAQARQLPLYSTRAGGFVDRTLQTKSTAAPRWQWLGPNNIAGRARTLEFDPRNPDRMLLGGVSGGVWVSTNAGQSWSPLSDDAANVNIGSLLVDPSEPDTIYAGTGELYRNSEQPYSAMWGMGILRSTDGGQSFQQLNATANDNFRYVADLAVSRHDHRRIYAATNSGIWRSDDRGAHFTRVLRPADGADQLRYEGCTDLLVLPDASRDVIMASCSSRSTDDRYYIPGTILPAACSGPCPAALYRNEDAGGAGQWQQVLTEAGMGRTTLDYARSSPNVLYGISASIVPGFDRTGDGAGDYNNGMHAVWRSNDGGRTWEARVRNNSPNALSTYLLSYADGFDAQRCDFGDTFIYGAGWYNQAIAVNPLNPEVVWVAGMDHYRSDDGGRTFGKASYWWLFGENSHGVHADQHLLRYHPAYNGTTNKRLYSTNDGGLAMTADDLAPTRRDANAACDALPDSVNWTALTSGLGTTQFYTGAVTSDGSMYMGGLQDNGTLLNRTDGERLEFQHVYGGDGAHVAIDPRNPLVIYASSQNIGLARSENAGSGFVAARAGLNDQVIFIMPFILDTSAPDRLYAGGTRVWRTDNQGRQWRQASAQFGTTFGHRVSALAVSPTNANRMLAGNQVGIHRTGQALASTSTTAWPSVSPRAGWVSSLEFDPVDANVAYATYSTFGGEHVWRSTDAGATWTAIDGSGEGRLPDVPVHTIAIDPQQRSRLYIGTDVGVFVSLDTGAHWARENAGFANVIVERLMVAPGAGILPPQLYAFTYGRGVWRVPLADLTGTADYRIGADSTGIYFDPAQSGQGWVVEAIESDGVTSVLAAWYTYLNGEQRWLIGNGVADGNRVRLPMFLGRGGQFIPAFNPADVVIEAWGEVELTFDDRDHLTARWTPTYAGYTSGSMPLTRLAGPSAADGASGTGSIGACHTGTWFNAGAGGYGLQVEVLGSGASRELLLILYTYLDGRPRWLIGQGPITGDRANLAVVTTNGGSFPPNASPANVVTQDWGTLTFRAVDANHARIDWNSTLPGFTAGGVDLTRLSSTLGRGCP